MANLHSQSAHLQPEKCLPQQKSLLLISSLPQQQQQHDSSFKSSVSPSVQSESECSSTGSSPSIKKETLCSMTESISPISLYIPSKPSEPVKIDLQSQQQPFYNYTQQVPSYPYATSSPFFMVNTPMLPSAMQLQQPLAPVSFKLPAFGLGGSEDEPGSSTNS